MQFGASYSTSNKLLLACRYILTTGLQKSHYIKARTKHVFCRDKYVLVLSRQNYVCREKDVSKTFVATKIILTAVPANDSKPVLVVWIPR